MKGLIRSFRDAGRGILRSAGTERNLRVHLAALCYVAAAGLLAGLDALAWAALLLCFGGIVGAELFNTALERLCDALHPARHPQIGAAKDAAAGAVLALALASAGVGLAVFGPWLREGGPIQACQAHPWLPWAVLLSLPAAAAWIAGPRTKQKRK